MSAELRWNLPTRTCDIESAASKIKVEGARYPEQFEKMTGL